MADKTLYHKLSETDTKSGFVDMSVELVDTLVNQGVEQVVFTTSTGRYFTYLDEWVDADIIEQDGVEGEGRWVKRMTINQMVKA